ncbi:MAG: HesA/MoeB/ThiF family protein [Muribaculaceae bacterium]|nr:HesA/MoeB/ThiF family protein [Muribaculaceae bacterium]
MDGDFKLRYARQIAISEIGKEGQNKICRSKVLIIGCGALGSMVAMQLAGAGVGTLGIADFDNIDVSNLQRQFFFQTEENGKFKVDVIASRIHKLNPNVKIISYPFVITSKKAEMIFGDYDCIVDATDNPDSKRMTGDISAQSGKPCCIGGVRDFGGQIMTFLPNDPRFEAFFGQGASDGLLPCSMGGVIGPAAVLCASVQAAEVLKYITNSGKILSGKILLFNLLTNTFQTFSL